MIAAKLDDIASQDYPEELIEVIIIDAASNDKTLHIVREWLSDRNLIGNPRFRIIEEPERNGKSASINKSFQEARPESEVLMMSDVDCRLGEGTLGRVARWFTDTSIGAVTGRQILLNSVQSLQVGHEGRYRDFYSSLRIAESHLDSTPIFHGECAAYRRAAIVDHRIIENSNADDSQMAVAARRSGFRAIYDPKITFFEMAPPDNEASRIQKVRRAQGLVRHFWRNKSMVLDDSFGSFRKVMALELSLHIVLPILVLLGFLTGLVHIGLVIDSTALEWQAILALPDLELMMLLADLLVIILLMCGFIGLPLPASNLSLTFFNYMVALVRAQLLILTGTSLHRWQQVPSVREALREHDLANHD